MATELDHARDARAATPPKPDRPAGVAGTRLAVVVLVGAALWFIPVPSGVEPRAWHLLAVFVATIVGLILRPIPTGAMAFAAAAFAVLSGTLTVAEATAGFGSTVVWLVVAAFFIAIAFIKTGLGTRIAYHFMRVLGKSSLGLAYGLVATDLVLAPAIPSNTARAGGVIFPILKSLCASLGSDAALGTQRRVAGFLTFTAYQGVVVTSTMFPHRHGGESSRRGTRSPAGRGDHMAALGPGGVRAGSPEPPRRAAPHLPSVSPRGHANPGSPGDGQAETPGDGRHEAGRADPLDRLHAPLESLDLRWRPRRQRHGHGHGRRGRDVGPPVPCGGKMSFRTAAPGTP